jgi:hypothetical protein
MLAAMMPRPVVVSVFTLLMLTGCGDSVGGSATASSTGVTGASGLTTVTTATTAGTDSTAAPTTGHGASEASAAQTSNDTDALPKLDVQSTLTGGETTGGPMMGGCEKVDFLFVIDNSGSMEDEQMNLINSFPGFIDTITQTLQAKDYHIMAVSTDNGMNTGLSSTCINGVCNCTPAPVCCENACGGFAQSCNGFDCDNLPVSQCNFEYGTGKEYDADGNHCMLADMRRYMLDTQPNVDQTFQCIANVGTYGSGDEKPMLAATEACGDKQNGPGGCDEGFLRDDAILVLTFITDEEDDNSGDNGGSPGEPADWYDAIVAAKNGDPKAVVVLGLLGDSNLPNGVCAPGQDPNQGGNGAEDGIRLQAFVDMFPNGVIGSVCAADYTPFFVEAVSVIDFACDTFEPPK